MASELHRRRLLCSGRAVRRRSPFATRTPDSSSKIRESRRKLFADYEREFSPATSPGRSPVRVLLYECSRAAARHAAERDPAGRVPRHALRAFRVGTGIIPGEKRAITMMPQNALRAFDVDPGLFPEEQNIARTVDAYREGADTPTPAESVNPTDGSYERAMPALRIFGISPGVHPGKAGPQMDPGKTEPHMEAELKRVPATSPRIRRFQACPAVFPTRATRRHPLRKFRLPCHLFPDSRLPIEDVSPVYSSNVADTPHDTASPHCLRAFRVSHLDEVPKQTIRTKCSDRDTTNDSAPRNCLEALRVSCIDEVPSQSIGAKTSNTKEGASLHCLRAFRVSRVDKIPPRSIDGKGCKGGSIQMKPYPLRLFHLGPSVFPRNEAGSETTHGRGLDAAPQPLRRFGANPDLFPE